MQRWRNFDVELTDHDVVGDIESVRVRVARSPAGEQRDSIEVRIPPKLRQSMDALAQDTLTLEQTIDLGQQLAEVLLPGQVGKLFDDSRAELEAEEGLRIRIELRSLPLNDLPWEYVYRASGELDAQAPERGFLGLDRSLSIVRYEPVARPARNLSPLDDQAIEVAMMLANPQIPGWPSLDLDAEAQAVESAVENEPLVRLDIHRQATDRTLNDVLDGHPHVFHFSGHGRFKLKPDAERGVYVGEGELLLETDEGTAAPTSARTIAAKMRGAGVRLVILNACETARRDSVNAFTGIAATLVRDGAPAVVAMQYGIRDSQALLLARRLYHNLADHQSIDAAVTAARLAMFNADQNYRRDWGIPVLYLRSDQAVLFPDKSETAPMQFKRLGFQGLVNLALSTLLVFALAFFYLRFIEPRLAFGTAIGGVFALALLVTFGFLKSLAGDSLRNLLLGWLRQKKASLLIAGLLALVAVGLWALPPPVALRVLAGKSLVSDIARSDLAAPLRVFRLTIKADQRQQVVEDFRKVGVSVAGSRGLAQRLAERYIPDTQSSIEDYIVEHGLTNNREAFLAIWQQQPAQSMGFSRLGKVDELAIILEVANAGTDQWSLVSCRRVELTDSMTTVFLEKDDECN